MPGIVGLISRQSAEACRALLNDMLASMQHEKFYVSGSYSAPELGVFAGWVTLDSAFAHCQPLVGDDRDVTLLISGECFFDEPVDAKQLVRVYEQQGLDFFERLNGLFSGLLLDRRQKRISLFNDRYGIERIYYHQNQDGFYFASEAKALLRVLPELRTFDNDGLIQFLRYGCTLQWNTLFRGIQVLPGGSVWSFRGDQTEKRRYFHVSSWESQAPLEPERFVTELDETFTRALARYFQTNTTVGISLTGGIDSRMIMACRPDSADVVAYTFASSGDTVDVRIAARVAAASRVPHHIIRLDHDFFANFASLVDRTIYVSDGCSGVCGGHEIYLHERARELAPVRLTGNYGSEILRGVTTLKPLGVCERLFHPDLIRTVSDTKDAWRRGSQHAMSRAAFEEIPWHLFGPFRAAQSQLTMRTPYLDNDIVALAFGSPEPLKPSPWPALQVIRRNDAALSRIITDTGLVPWSPALSLITRPWYRATFKLDYWRTVELPGLLSAVYPLMSRVPMRLSAFPEHRFLHYRSWFQAELAEYVRERLNDSQVLNNALWNRRFIEHMAEDHISGRANYLREIDLVLTCSAVDRLLLGSDV